MPVFEYVAMTNQGKRKKNLFICDSKQMIQEELKKFGLFPVAIKQIEKLPKVKKISTEKIYAFTRDLAQLLKAKIALYDAIKAIQERKQEADEQVFLIGVLDELKKGMPLSQILAAYPRCFDSVFLSVVKAGEESGKLEEAFISLETIIKKQLEIKKKIASQTVYPKILLVISTLLILGVLAYLIPSFKELIENKELKGITKFVFFLSDLLINKPLIFFSPFIGIFLVIITLNLFSSVKEKLEVLKLYLPLVKDFQMAKIFSKFALVLKTLLKAKIPPVEALKLAKKALGHPLIEKEMDRIIHGMQQGKKFSEELKKSIYIPSFICQVVSAREEVSALEDAFDLIYLHYEEHLDRSLQNLTNYIQPFLFIILGLVIGMVILSVLIPLTDTSNFTI